MEVQLFHYKATPSYIKDLFSSNGSAEMDWSWFVTTAQTAIKADEELVVAALVDADGSCRSALPLVRRKNSFRGATSCFTTEFLPPLGDENSAFLLAQGIAHKCSDLRLDSLPEDFGSMQAFVAGLESAGFATGTYRHFANWYEEITDFGEYWKTRSGKLRSLVRRKGKALSMANRLMLERIDLRTDIKRAVVLYEQIYTRSWKEPEEHERFLPTLLRDMGHAGLVQFGIAHVDGMPAAAQVWLVQRPRATIFKLAHNLEFDQYSPGSLLTHWMIGQIHGPGEVCQFDFGRGNDEYKKLWMRNCRFRFGVIAVNPLSPCGAWRYITDIIPTRMAKLRGMHDAKRRLKQRWSCRHSPSGMK